MIDNIEFEEKVNIEDLGLPSNSTGISNMETIEIKEEPLEQSRSMISIHESNTSGGLRMDHEGINSSSFASNKAFQPEIILRFTPQSGVLPSNLLTWKMKIFNQKL